MNINIIILIVLIGTSAGATHLLMGSQKPIVSNKTIDKKDNTNLTKAPDFTFNKLNGETASFSDYWNNPVVIHFWATWCAPCLVELPEIISLASEKPDITVLALSSDNSKETIDRFLEKYEPLPDNFIVIHDRGKSLTQDLFQTFKLPESYILSRSGSIKEKIIGAYEGWGSYDFE